MVDNPKAVQKVTVTRKLLKWDKDFPEKMLAFFDQDPYEEIKEPVLDKEQNYVGDKITRIAKPIPSIRAFAKACNIHYTTIYDWLDPDSPRHSKRLAKAYEVAKKIRKDILIQGGLLGFYNSNFTKFVAVNLTDMVSEKQILDQTIAGKEGQPMPKLNIIMRQLEEDTGTDAKREETEETEEETD